MAFSLLNSFVLKLFKCGGAILLRQCYHCSHTSNFVFFSCIVLIWMATFVFKVLGILYTCFPDKFCLRLQVVLWVQHTSTTLSMLNSSDFKDRYFVFISVSFVWLIILVAFSCFDKLLYDQLNDFLRILWYLLNS